MKRLTGNDPTPRQFVSDMLPDHYYVQEMVTGIIRCISSEGVDDDGQWESFMTSLREYFGDAFREVYHWTCSNHLDFTVYYNYYTLYNLEINEDYGFSLSNRKQQNK